MKEYAIAKVCRALTKEYGFYFAPKNSKARNKSRLRPHQLRKYNLRSSVLDAQVNSRSWNDFISTLKGQGIDMRFNHAENSDKIVVYPFVWMNLALLVLNLTVI